MMVPPNNLLPSDRTVARKLVRYIQTSKPKKVVGNYQWQDLCEDLSYFFASRKNLTALL